MVTKLSELTVQAQLHDARTVAGVQPRDLAERRVALRHSRIPEIRVIEEVQHLQPELQAMSLRGEPELLQDDRSMLVRPSP